METVVAKAKVQIASAIRNDSGHHLLVTAKQSPDGTYVPQSWAVADSLKDAQTWTMTVTSCMDNETVSLYREFTISLDGERYALEHVQNDQRAVIKTYSPGAESQRWYANMSGQAGTEVLGYPQPSSPARPLCLDLYRGNTSDGTPIKTYILNVPEQASNQQWQIRYLEALPGPVPQQYTITKTLLESAHSDPELRIILLADPAHLFSDSGYALQPEQYVDFNAYFRANSGLIQALQGDRPLAEAVAGWQCTLCEISCWALAAGIVALGATALGAMTLESPIVVALAGFASVTPLVAKAFLGTLISVVGFGITAVVTHICEWADLC